MKLYTKLVTVFTVAAILAFTGGCAASKPNCTASIMDQSGFPTGHFQVCDPGSSTKCFCSEVITASF